MAQRAADFQTRDSRHGCHGNGPIDSRDRYRALARLLEIVATNQIEDEFALLFGNETRARFIVSSFF